MKIDNVSFEKYEGNDVFLLPKEAVKLIDEADTDFFSVKNALMYVEAGSHELFLIRVNDEIKCVFVGEFQPILSGKGYCISALSGKQIDTWFKQLVMFMDLKANLENIDNVYIVGRRGWGKKFNGFKEAAVIYECVVANSTSLRQLH